MKKILFALILSALTLTMTFTMVKAEETTTVDESTTTEDVTTEDVTTTEEEITTTDVTTDEITTTEKPTEDEKPVDENEPTLEEFKNELKDFLSQYIEESAVVKIITWLIDAGVLSALFVVYVKYRKYKHTTIEDLTKQFGDKVGKWLKENFDKLSKEEIAKITSSIDDLEKANETIMKVLILMQDNTAKGKAALIEYLGSKTNSEEIKTAAKEVNETLEEQQANEEQVKSKVAGEYEDIF